MRARPCPAIFTFFIPPPHTALQVWPVIAHLPVWELGHGDWRALPEAPRQQVAQVVCKLGAGEDRAKKDLKAQKTGREPSLGTISAGHTFPN